MCDLWSPSACSQGWEKEARVSFLGRTRGNTWKGMERTCHSLQELSRDMSKFATENSQTWYALDRTATLIYCLLRLGLPGSSK